MKSTQEELKSMQEELKSTQEELKNVKEVLTRLDNDFKTLKQMFDLANERNKVIENKRNLLLEMLTVGFQLNIQDIDMKPVQHEHLIQHRIPIDIAKSVTCWMGYYWKDDTTRCDLNARACWATILGNMHKDWVYCNTGSNHVYNNEFLTFNVTKWTDVLEKWKNDTSRIALIVRFIGKFDGHTVVLYKYDGMIYTFQSYYTVCVLQMHQGCIFTDELNYKINCEQIIFANEFGVGQEFYQDENYAYPSNKYASFIYTTV